METAARLTTPAPSFTDGFGTRRQRPAANGVEEVLELRSELTAVRSFEFAVRERIGRLSSFSHPSFVPSRRVERLAVGAQTLAVVSEAVEGSRLSLFLDAAERNELRIDPVWALVVVRQVLDALGALHESDRDLFHGAIAPERIVIARSRRALVADAMLGSAIEQLRYEPRRYWHELGAAGVDALRRFDQRLDVRQAGYVALALLLGRPLRRDEGCQSETVVEHCLSLITARVDETPILADASRWLRRSLEIDEPFRSAYDAAQELGGIVARNGMVVDDPRAWDLPPIAVAAEAVALDVSESSAITEPAITEPDADDGVADLASVVSAPVESPAIDPRRDTLPVRDSGQPALVRAASRVPSLTVYITAAIAVAIVAGLAYRVSARGASVPKPSFGTLAVSTPGSGVEVFIDQVKRGVTPIDVQLSPGQHQLELREGSSTRTLPITVAPGSVTSQYIELRSEAPSTGGLRVHTQPEGAMVTVDGVSAGRSPITLDEVAPGEHIVIVAGDAAPIKQVVTVERGVVASLLVSRDTSAPVERNGSVAFSSPIELQVFENERLVGNTVAGRLSLPPGMHVLDLLNVSLEYGARKKVQIKAGQMTPITIDVPKGTLAINAAPWASVWLDGQSLGETPIGNVKTPIGAHEIVFRHPSLGEQRRTVAVPVNGVARVSVDFKVSR